MCKKIFSFILISFVPLITLAQGTACDGTDPLDPCATPLDTWVIVLVVNAGILATIHLHRKQKSLQA